MQTDRSASTQASHTLAGVVLFRSNWPDRCFGLVWPRSNDFSSKCQRRVEISCREDKKQNLTLIALFRCGYVNHQYAFFGHMELRLRSHDTTDVCEPTLFSRMHAESCCFFHIFAINKHNRNWTSVKIIYWAKKPSAGKTITHSVGFLEIGKFALCFQSKMYHKLNKLWMKQCHENERKTIVVHSLLRLRTKNVRFYNNGAYEIFFSLLPDFLNDST